MKNLIKRLGPFTRNGKCVQVVIETPKGSRVKYAFDRDSGLFELKRALPEGMVFPFNFGFIPSTLATDGDPLDILVLNEEPLVPGCLLKAKLIGAIRAEQTQDGKTERNDRLIGLAIAKESPAALQGLELAKKTQFQIEYFFKTYNKLDGKKFKVIGASNAGKARLLVEEGAKKYQREKKKKG